MATMVSVVTLVLTNQPLTAVSVFMLIAFMNILRLGNYNLTLGLLGIYEASVSLNRIENFLLLDNLQSISSDQSSVGTNGSVGSSPNIGSGQVNDKKENLDMSNIAELNGKQTISVSNLTYKPMRRENKTVASCRTHYNCRKFNSH